MNNHCDRCLTLLLCFFAFFAFAFLFGVSLRFCFCCVRDFCADVGNLNGQKPCAVSKNEKGKKEKGKRENKEGKKKGKREKKEKEKKEKGKEGKKKRDRNATRRKRRRSECVCDVSRRAGLASRAREGLLCLLELVLQVAHVVLVLLYLCLQPFKSGTQTGTQTHAPMGLVVVKKTMTVMKMVQAP